jgi:arginine decarboxylase-like protein
MNEASATPAHKVYNIAHWSDGYIGVNDQGEVLIRPDRGHSDARINLPELTRALTDSGVQLPVLVRFVDILHDRVNKLCNAFNKVAGEHAYQGRYTAVYPIKVNQQRRVVEELPYREKQLKAALRERGVGRLTIKKRGVDVVPEVLRKRLSLSGDAEATLVMTRVAGSGTALLVQPL